MQYGRAIKEKIKTADTDQVICDRDETGKEKKPPDTYDRLAAQDVDCRQK